MENHPNIEFIEQKLIELASNLEALRRQKLLALKDCGQASPGLLDAITRLEQRQGNFRDSLELWRTVLKVYPNYDRDNK